MFFEGSEKKLEVIVSADVGNLRDLGKVFWSDIVAKCHATVLSIASNEHVDAYLLSESSLFVWKDRFLMLTCGETRLIESVIAVLEHFNRDAILSVLYQRKNEYLSHLQHTSFEQDVARLKELIGGESHILGRLDGHHNFVYHLEKPYTPDSDDITTELLMYHIQGAAADYLRSEGQTREGIRGLFALDKLLPGFVIDDFVFEPFGYSLNAIRDDNYLTIHITPQEDSSYVSFETDLDLVRDNPALLTHIVELLQPQSYDLVTFNHTPKLATQRSTLLIDDVQHKPEHFGYDMRFRHYLIPLTKVRKSQSF